MSNLSKWSSFDGNSTLSFGSGFGSATFSLIWFIQTGELGGHPQSGPRTNLIDGFTSLSHPRRGSSSMPVANSIILRRVIWPFILLPPVKKNAKKYQYFKLPLKVLHHSRQQNSLALFCKRNKSALFFIVNKINTMRKICWCFIETLSLPKREEGIFLILLWQNAFYIHDLWTHSRQRKNSRPQKHSRRQICQIHATPFYPSIENFVFYLSHFNANDSFIFPSNSVWLMSQSVQ